MAASYSLCFKSSAEFEDVPWKDINALGKENDGEDCDMQVELLDGRLGGEDYALLWVEDAMGKACMFATAWHDGECDRLIIENLLPLHDAGLHRKFFKGMINWLATRYSGTAKGMHLMIPDGSSVPILVDSGFYRGTLDDIAQCDIDLEEVEYEVPHVLMIFYPPSPAVPASGAAKRSAMRVETDARNQQRRRLLSPSQWVPSVDWPNREDQLASYCGGMMELIKYANEKHAEKSGMSTQAVKKWLERNPNFIPSWLLDQPWSVDHIISDKIGGHPWPYNYFIMPRADNSHFNQYAAQEKKKYVGTHAWESASQFARWTRDAGRGRINYSAFDPITDKYRGRAY